MKNYSGYLKNLTIPLSIYPFEFYSHTHSLAHSLNQVNIMASPP